MAAVIAGVVAVRQTRRGPGRYRTYTVTVDREPVAILALRGSRLRGHRVWDAWLLEVGGDTPVAVGRGRDVLPALLAAIARKVGCRDCGAPLPQSNRRVGICIPCTFRRL